MNEIKRNEMFGFFAERMNNCKSMMQQLQEDGRTDEAVFAKIRLNIYQIFNSVFSVAIDTCGQEDEKVVQFFLIRLQQIPQSWYTALSAAEQHGDEEKAHIERIKLDAIADIQKGFQRIWEVDL